MRILNWNIEWMNKWFSGNQNPQWGSGELSASRSQEAAGRAANVINAIDPDLITLQEGPSALAEMQLFIDTFLTDGAGVAKYNAMIGRDGAAQKLYGLAKVDGRVAAFDYAQDDATNNLLDAWDADVNGDLLLEPYEFTRSPLVLDIDPAGSEPFRIVVLHTKSKYVHRGQQLWDNPSRRHEFVAQAMEARRRISAEGYRLRAYLDELVSNDNDARIVVTGDFNDGPGHDMFERKYLTHNVTDIVLGSTFYPDLIFSHPLLQHVPAASLFTARFDDFVDDVDDRPLLLDHFLVSPGLNDRVQSARIAHAEHDAEVDGNGVQRHQRPSDHRPVVLELQ